MSQNIKEGQDRFASIASGTSADIEVKEPGLLKQRTEIDFDETCIVDEIVSISEDAFPTHPNDNLTVENQIRRRKTRDLKKANKNAQRLSRIEEADEPNVMCSGNYKKLVT